jgi:phospholipase C
MLVADATEKIKYVFVLMLENRSYDHLLGYLKLSGTAPGQAQSVIEAEGLVGVESNPSPSAPGGLVHVSPTEPDSPGFDPHHEFPDIRTQLTGQAHSGAGGAYPQPLSLAGFVESNGPEVMRCLAPARIPVLAALASEFAVCDHWYSSLPGPTWPNRLFVHAASSGGLCCSPSDAASAWKTTFGHYDFQHGTVYDQLTKAGKKWRIYHQGIPQTLTLAGMGLKYLFSDDFRDFEHFPDDLKAGYAIDYTFIEPHYGGLVDTQYSEGNSQHPNGNIQDGEKLIRDVYTALRNSPVWEHSLLVITYDEHGGFYDHVRPPAAVAPGDDSRHAGENSAGEAFDFKTYGVRVPAVVVSPWIAPHTVDQSVLDHSSVSKTLHSLFGTATLTARDAQAKDLCHLLSLAQPRLSEEEAPLFLAVAAPPPAGAAAAVASTQDQPVEGLNKLLLGLGAQVDAAIQRSSPQTTQALVSLPGDHAALSQLDGIRTRLEAAQYLQGVHSRVIAQRRKAGFGKPVLWSQAGPDPASDLA